MCWAPIPGSQPIVTPELHYTVGLLGAGGYVGQAVHALLSQHPCMSAEALEARDPQALAWSELRAWSRFAAVILAVPDEAAQQWAPALREAGVSRILDLSGAHRCQPHVHYGLPELFGAPQASDPLVANPGCYPTATLLALRPLIDAGVIAPTPIAVVGASGASGAGHGLASHLHFCELHGNLFPYRVGTHRHIPEIEHHLGAEIAFVTQLLPVVRGLMVTAFVSPTAEPAAVHETLVHAYRSHPYVSVLPAPGVGLGIRHVVGSHQALVAVGPSTRSGLLPVFCTIDNLMRGAASQALCNLNSWLGLDPHLGLPPPLGPTHERNPGMGAATP